MIVTTNLRDFPAAMTTGFGIEAVHPDAFIVGLIEAYPDNVALGMRRLLAAFKDPLLTPVHLLLRMKRHDLAGSADALHGLI